MKNICSKFYDRCFIINDTDNIHLIYKNNSDFENNKYYIEPYQIY